MRRFILAFAAATAAMFALPVSDANARFPAQAVEAPTLLEEAACTTRRVRTVRPNGRVVRKTVRRCGPGIQRGVERCRVVRERVVRPNGRAVTRVVRRCR